MLRQNVLYKMYWTPTEMLLLADVDEYSFTNAEIVSASRDFEICHYVWKPGLKIIKYLWSGLNHKTMLFLMYAQCTQIWFSLMSASKVWCSLNILCDIVTVFDDMIGAFRMFHSSPPRQNGYHFADGVFKCIFVNENFVFQLKFYWSLFQLTITHHWFR